MSASKRHVQRESIGVPERHRGHIIEVEYLGPDLLCLVDGQQVGGYWLNAEAARRAGRTHIDQVEDEREKKNG